MDLTCGRQLSWVARYEKWMGGGGGGCCECPLETIQPNFGLGRSPNSFALFKSLSLYHTVLRCNMQIEITRTEPVGLSDGVASGSDWDPHRTPISADLDPLGGGGVRLNPPVYGLA